MSVLIKGMGMPTAEQGVRTINIYADGVVTNYAEEIIGKAVPVPPHGRLIDADALGDFPYNMDFCDGWEADVWVQDAPTVIEAEGGE